MRPRSQAWQQHVDQPEIWANAHIWLLQEIFDAFNRSGEWPSLAAVQHAASGKDTERALAVAQLVLELPGELGARQGEQIVMNVRAVAHCEGAGPLLVDFLAAVSLAARAYREAENGASARIDGRVLKDALGLDEQRLLRLIALLEREPWPFGGGGGNPGEEWYRNVTVDALAFEQASTPEEYLDAVARLRYGPPEQPDAPPDGPVIELGRRWVLGERIGGGGFGQVYEALGGEGPAVAKLVPIAPGADRELLLAELGGVPGIVPVLDDGEFDGHIVLVMPRAQMSLREHIDANGPAFASAEVRTILAQIAATLAAIDGNVVHRDIKPENILRLNGAWCLTDFGIARYADASTAADTRKHAKTPDYAAPEQWREQRATAAADVYALGVIAYELLAGVRPFTGPDLREQHLHDSPPPLRDEDRGLLALIADCLTKAAQARPSAARLVRWLQQPAVPASSGLAALQDASTAQSQRGAETARALSRARSELERRHELANAAADRLGVLLDGFQEAIADAGSAVSMTRRAEGARILRLGPAELRLLAAAQATGEELGPAVAFDVISFAAVELERPPDSSGYTGRSHSLWYCDAKVEGQYAWFETAFDYNAFLGGSVDRSREPFALAPRSEAAEALGPGVGAYQVAWPFMVLEEETLTDFTDRWARWLALASRGPLPGPGDLRGGDPGGSWRRD